MATDNDLVVFFNNKYYLVTEGDWKANPLAAAAVNAKAKAAIKKGAKITYISNSSLGIGVGAYSALVNLSKIKKK